MDYDLNLNLNHVENEILKKKYVKHVEFLMEKTLSAISYLFSTKKEKKEINA